MATTKGIQLHLATIVTFTVCITAIFFAWHPATASAINIGADPNGKMIGGQIAPPKQFPSFVSLRILELAIPHFCSGTIINANWILTAAICVGERANISRIVLVMGTVRMQDIGQRHRIERVIRHPQFTGRSSDFLAHNVALVKTTRPMQITTNPRVQAIKLFLDDVVDVGHLCIIGGWRERHPQDRLRLMSVKTIDQPKCRDELPSFQRGYVLNETLCTENDIGQGLNHGDYGTALISSSNGQLIGIGSVFMFAVQGGQPDIFLRVAPYAQWLFDVIRDN